MPCYTNYQLKMMKPMKKIKSIKQLNAEKKRLKLRRAELEKAIVYDWRDLKGSLSPKNIAGQAFSKLFDGDEKKNGHSIISDTVSELAATFTKKLVEKAEGKIGKWFK